MPIKASQLVHSILGVGYVGDHDSAVNFNNASYTTKIKYKQLIRIKQEGDRHNIIYTNVYVSYSCIVLKYTQYLSLVHFSNNNYT